ncbi:MFS transporter [Actinocatenispora rupis]|uniref:MFS transporter n=1 Tax=Actinocatenispora rupis TaxID=519421 RepID=A0A8J3NE80_9ACTN|nr:MFS transporter [Actinocatenispora rupis]GID13777.1 MFS transporter [Actinocatenispora rupis]
MPALSPVATAARVVLRGGRAALDGTERLGRFAVGHVRTARDKGGAGDVGMIRLLDLHAASCAGDALVAIGLAGTIFFAGATSDARAKVALYLLVTMAPFALLAPVVGPVLDRFRHGRRYALAVTMLGRAFLAWVISDQMHTFALYPAAFGVLVLSRSYGVARSAAVPRLLPPGLGLVEAGARASLFGTVAGAVLGGVGLVAAWFGPQWPLRLATVVFVLGMIVALRLPPRADSEPPETPPRVFQVFRTHGVKVLSGKLLWAALAGSATLRAGYGFLTLFLAFRVRDGDFALRIGSYHVPQYAMLGLVVGGLGVGSFLATAVCTRLTIRRPLLIQSVGLAATALAGIGAALLYGVWTVAALCLVTAFASGVAKLSVDAVIQERMPEKLRASAFSHSETLLMLAFVLGGAIGLLPLPGRVGTAILAAGVVAAAVRVGWWAWQLRAQRLRGVIGPDEQPTVRVAPRSPVPDGTRPDPTADKTRPMAADRTRPMPAETTRPMPAEPAGTAPDPTRRMPGTADEPADDRTTEPIVPPGYHLYRPGRRTPPP